MEMGVDMYEFALNHRIVYAQYSDDDLIFYQYDMEKKETCRLGTIKNWHISSSDKVIYENCVYVWYQLRDGFIENEQNNIVCTLYRIDLDEKKVEVYDQDTVYQQLIYVDTLGDRLISYKGRLDGNDAITYLEAEPLSEADRQGKEILEKRIYNMSSGKGEVIDQFCESNGRLYTVESIYEDDSIVNCQIRVYESNGECVRAIGLDQSVYDILKEDYVLKFEVFGNYAFIRTFGDFSMILDISEETAVTVYQWDNFAAVDIVQIRNGQEPDSTVLFSRGNGKIWEWKINDAVLIPYDLPYQSLAFVDLIDEDMILITSYDEEGKKETVLANLRKMPILRSE